MAAVLNAALGFLELLLGKFDWWLHVKEALLIAIVAAEAVGDDSKEKKQEVVNMILKYLKDRDINVPIWDWLFKLLLGLIVDILIGYLNKNIGKDWAKQLAAKEGLVEETELEA